MENTKTINDPKCYGCDRTITFAEFINELIHAGITINLKNIKQYINLQWCPECIIREGFID